MQERNVEQHVALWYYGTSIWTHFVTLEGPSLTQGNIAERSCFSKWHAFLLERQMVSDQVLYIACAALSSICLFQLWKLVIIFNNLQGTITLCIVCFHYMSTRICARVPLAVLIPCFTSIVRDTSMFSSLFIFFQTFILKEISNKYALPFLNVALLYVNVNTSKDTPQKVLTCAVQMAAVVINWCFNNQTKQTAYQMLTSHLSRM